MSRVIGDSLPKEVMQLMPGGRPCAVATIDQVGRPYICIMGGVMAIDEHTIRLGCWGAGTTVNNMKLNPWIMIETLGPKAIAVQCKVKILKEKMEHSMFPPNPYTLVEGEVQSVKDDAPPGLTIKPMEYDYGARTEKLTPLEEGFMNELRLG